VRLTLFDIITLMFIAFTAGFAMMRLAGRCG
jgi:hypothetical protein